MKLNNNSEYTISSTRKALATISRHADLNQPREVKMFIALLKNVTDGYKKNLCIAYNKYCKFYQIEWKMPFYQQEAKVIKLPTKEKLIMLISSAQRPLSIKLQISMEAGLRPVELMRLKAKDIDLDHNAVMPTTAKGGNPRAVKISNNLKTSIEQWIRDNKLNPNDRLFHGTGANYGYSYRGMRNRLAQKMNDPTIKSIRLYDSRHYFCTKTLRDSGDPFFTMCQMGHKKLTTTQLYMHLVNLENDEWTCRAAATKEEVMSLIEGGFQYVTTIEGIHQLQKTKIIGAGKAFKKQLTRSLIGERQMKSLVVYYSRTGNTKFVAEKIAQELGADIEEVIDKKNRSGKIGWLSAGKDAMQRNKTEIAETNKKPSEYDLIVVGTPNWCNKPSPAIRTYLSKYDLAGKRVATFCLTDGYSGGEKVIEEIRALIPNSDSNEHLVVSKPTENKTDTENKISEWCNRLKSL